MKIRVLTLAFFILATQLTFAALDSNLIKKRWKIVTHNKKNKPLPHHVDDFLQFNASNSLEQVQEGMYITGTWKLNAAENLLTLTTPEESVSWTITELTSKTLKATYKNEVLEMEVVPLKFCSGDPYADLTIICGKWKIATHMVRYSRVAYRPGDYIQFFEDGTVEKVFNGRYKKMTWKYEDRKLIVSDVTWNIQDMDPKQLKAEITSKNETIVLKKL